MPRLSRRALLALSTTAATTLAGCTNAVDPQSSSVTPSPTPAVTPPERTPAESECVASVPTPDTRKDFPAPMGYPAPPADLSVDAVSTFVERFERAYSHNSTLLDLSDANCVQTVDASVTVSTFDAVDAGVVGRVTVRRSYTSGGCEKPGDTTETTTPIHADFSPVAITYYVTDRLVLREGEPVVCR